MADIEYKHKDNVKGRYFVDEFVEVVVTFTQ